MDARFVTEAKAIGGAIAEVFDDYAGKAKPATCLEAICALAKVPALNNAGLLSSLVWYASQVSPTKFVDAVQACLAHCEPASILVAAEFTRPRTWVHHRREVFPRPTLLDAFHILAELAKVGLKPKSDVALLNCSKLLRDAEVSWGNVAGMAKAITADREGFGRAARGEPHGVELTARGALPVARQVTGSAQPLCLASIKGI
jgi:hypothetical protein